MAAILEICGVSLLNCQTKWLLGNITNQACFYGNIDAGNFKKVPYGYSSY